LTPDYENGRMVSDRIVEQLRYAHARWRDVQAVGALSAAQARACLDDAKALLAAGAGPIARDSDSVMIVTKAPHAGSNASVLAIVARCLAFGTHVCQVVRMDPEAAEAVAHALYPDVWLNFARRPVGDDAWERLSAIYDRSEYAEIFGEAYRPEIVVTGHQACADNGLELDDLMAIWQSGREPLNRHFTLQTYGRTAAELIFRDINEYNWYRGDHPIGIQKVGSGMMAFALRHPSLYDGRPTIVLNGHFALLSRLFRGHDGRGAAVIELALGPHLTVRDVRTHLTGAADMPAECRPGSIRRDAFDGHFDVDVDGVPVTAWANVVHSSDGYLAGAIETGSLLGTDPRTLFHRSLDDAGYTAVEMDALIDSDPVIVAHGDEQRLTKRTAWASREDCLNMIKHFFPPLRSVGVSSPSLFPLPTLLEGLPSDAEKRASLFDRPHPEPLSRRPQNQPTSTTALPPEHERHGDALLDTGAVGFLVPLAGSGGRFGGYDKREGSTARLKPLLPLFTIGGATRCALDIRGGHARHLALRHGHHVPLLLSCSQHTEPHIRRWAAANRDLQTYVLRVAEMYRLRAEAHGTACAAPDATAADHIVRNGDGIPLLKPSGSLGLLTAGASEGVFAAWQQAGVQFVVVANSDDVGFRIDRRLLGLLAADECLDAVVVTVSVDPLARDREDVRIRRGGFLRERPVDDGWSAYVEEFATATGPSEQFNTNQIYFRLSSLVRAVGDPREASGDDVRRRLPLYFETKAVTIDEGRRIDAIHAYQASVDILRVMPRVASLQMPRDPGSDHWRGFAPLKTPDDVAGAQAFLDSLNAHDELSLPTGAWSEQTR
jgi:hypothetical protein